MKIGYFAIGIGQLTNPEWVRAAATTAERVGFSTLWAPEHVVLVDRFSSKYPYSAGELPMPTDTPMADPLVALVFAAACTKTIRLATGICLVPEHNPLVLAKTAATADRLSGGRLVLGTGIGWLEEEFRALGVPWERRAQRTREYIDVMRKLWREDRSSYSGEFVRFSDVRSFPKPANPRGIPVWFGGESEPALQRVAEYGDGWVGFNLTPDQAAAKVRRIEELLKASGRKRSDVELTASPYKHPVTTDDLKRYSDAGLEEIGLFNFDILNTERDLTARIERMAKEFVEPAAKL
jgi:probable F420-dependent oxidoreductase